MWNSINKSIRSIFLGLCLASPVLADAPVWQIDKDGRLLYLGGTLHLLTPRDYPLPEAFERAYRGSQLVVFETDIEKLRTPDWQRQLLQQLSFNDGRKLHEVISPETWAALTEFFGARGVPMSDIDRFKPGMVSLLMSVFELRRMGVTAVGVDDYFSDRARQDQKQTGQLENIEQQIEYLANMGEGREDAMLAYSLADVERLPELWRALKLAWRNGDLATLDELAAAPLREQFPQVYQSLLVARNRDWMPQIEAMADSSEVELVLVGALHLAGEDGLLAMLARRGYRVTQMP